MSKFLNKSYHVKNFSVLLLLFAFTLGITPRITLHNWFANHKDSTSKTPVTNTQQLTKAGFNCNCENLVAESNFVTFNTLLVADLPSVHSFVLSGIPSLVSLSLFHNNLRGPPVKF